MSTALVSFFQSFNFHAQVLKRREKREARRREKSREEKVRLLSISNFAVLLS